MQLHYLMVFYIDKLLYFDLYQINEYINSEAHNDVFLQVNLLFYRYF